MNATQDTRTRDAVRNEPERAISGAMSGLAVIKALAGASVSGNDEINDCALDWLAGKAHDEASAAFDLAEEFDRAARPAQTPEQKQRSEEAVARHVRERAEKAWRDLAEAEAYEALRAASPPCWPRPTKGWSASAPNCWSAPTDRRDAPGDYDEGPGATRGLSHVQADTGADRAGFADTVQTFFVGSPLSFRPANLIV